MAIDLVSAVGNYLLGEGIDVAAEETGLKKRARGILSELANAFIPEAAASDASAIPQNVPPVPPVPDVVNNEGAGANILPIESGRSTPPQIQQASPTRLPDIQMGQTPEERAAATQQFVRDNTVPDGNVQAGNSFFTVAPETLAMLDRGQVSAMDVDEARKIVRAGDFVFNKMPKIKQVAEETGDDSIFDAFGQKVKEYFGDEENMTRLALAFNSMRLQPDQGLAAVLGKRLETLDARRTATLTANKTVEALRRVGTPQAMKFSAMIEANPSMAKEIYKEYVKSSGAGFDKDIVKGESDLRKEFTGLPTVKDFQSQSTAFGRVVASAKDPSAAGDLALIFNYMKVLDPGSTVREGEFATAQNASGVPGRVQSLYNNIIRGERLNEDQRGDFVDRARRLYMSAASSYESIRDDYVDIASSYQFDVERTVPDLFSQQKNIVDPPKPSYGSLPDSVKSKYSADDFDRLWNGMSYLTKLQLSGS